MARTRFPCLRHSKASAEDCAKLWSVVLATVVFEVEVTEPAEEGGLVRGGVGGRGGSLGGVVGCGGAGERVTRGGDWSLIRGGRTLGDAECEGGLRGRVVVLVLVRIMRLGLAEGGNDPGMELLDVTDEATE